MFWVSTDIDQKYQIEADEKNDANWHHISEMMPIGIIYTPIIKVCDMVKKIHNNKQKSGDARYH